MPPPKVFISYSHDSPAHADRVWALANKLRADGIDAILDQFEEFGPPEGWQHWMTIHLRDADFVLMLCTECYYARVMGTEPPGTGQGVKWEGKLIMLYLSEGDMINKRFLPALFDDGKTEHIPDPLRPFNHYRLDGEQGYAKLYRCLTHQPAVKAGKLGPIKSLPELKRRHDFFREAPHNIPLVGPVEWPRIFFSVKLLSIRFQAGFAIAC